MTIGYGFVIMSKWSLLAPLAAEQGTLAAHPQVLVEAELEVEVEIEMKVEAEVE